MVWLLKSFYPAIKKRESFSNCHFFVSSNTPKQTFSSKLQSQMDSSPNCSKSATFYWWERLITIAKKHHIEHEPTNSCLTAILLSDLITGEWKRKTGTRQMGGRIDYDHNRATYEFDCVTYLTHRYGLSVFDFFAICKYLTCTRKKKKGEMGTLNH